MKRPLKIGITGGIGSGKTTVTDVFKHLGIPVYLADDRAKWLMNNDQKLVKKITTLFGKQAYQGGALNRKYIAQQVFQNKALITQLNTITHPAVFRDFDLWVRKQQSPYVIKEAALLFESGSYLDLDAIITVDAPLDLRIDRTIKRDQVTEKDVMARIKNQMPDEVKRNAADYLIINDGATPLLPQILLLHQILR
jgi:dephospho-CoA kinase